MRPTIDGEQKVLLTRINPSEMRLEGLMTRSLWEARKAIPGTIIATQRAFNGAMLHDQRLVDPETGLRSFAPNGHVFPSKLMKGRSGQHRTGKAMNAQLEASKELARETRQYARLIQNAKKVIL